MRFSAGLTQGRSGQPTARRRRSDASAPLKDILVCDFTVALAGPSSTIGLAQLGARVIKIERNENPERDVPLILVPARRVPRNRPRCLSRCEAINHGRLEES